MPVKRSEKNKAHIKNKAGEGLSAQDLRAIIRALPLLKFPHATRKPDMNRRKVSLHTTYITWIAACKLPARIPLTQATTVAV